MRLEPVRVECYSGYRADETPRRIQVGGRWKVVREVLDRWYQGWRDPEWPAAEYFRVRCEKGEVLLLRHDQECDEWYVVHSSGRRQPGWGGGG